MEDNRQRNAQNFGVVLSHEEGQEKRLTRCGHPRHCNAKNSVGAGLLK